MCHPFFCQDENVRHLSTLSLAYLQGQLQRILIAILYLRSSFYQIRRIMQLPIAIDVDICPRLQQNLSLSSPLIDQKILYFCGPGDNKESLIDVPEWGRERKKWPCFMHVCILSSFVQRYVGSLAMPQVLRVVIFLMQYSAWVMLIMFERSL